jgi:hypothetical protein
LIQESYDNQEFDMLNQRHNTQICKGYGYLIGEKSNSL